MPLDDDERERIERIESSLDELAKQSRSPSRTPAQRESARSRGRDILDELEPEERRLIETHRFRTLFKPEFDRAIQEHMDEIAAEAEREFGGGADDEGEEGNPPKPKAKAKPKAPGRHASGEGEGDDDGKPKSEADHWLMAE